LRSLPAEESGERVERGAGEELVPEGDGEDARARRLELAAGVLEVLGHDEERVDPVARERSREPEDVAGDPRAARLPEELGDLQGGVPGKATVRAMALANTPSSGGGRVRTAA